MSSAISSCIDARIDVSGVRSSWLTIEMNCDFRRSSSRASVTSEPMPIRYDVAARLAAQRHHRPRDHVPRAVLADPGAIELDRFGGGRQPRNAFADVGAIVVEQERHLPERPARDLRHRHARQLFAGAVEAHDLALRVEHHDQARRGIEDGRHEIALGAQLRLRVDAIGDVARHALEAFDPARR